MKTRDEIKQTQGSLTVPAGRPWERGTGLVVVIMLLAFMLTVGMVLITTTSSGPEVAGSLRIQQQAFNAAEAGFDTAWLDISLLLVDKTWLNFDEHYLQEPAGIDIPIDDIYFRRQTDDELLAMIGDIDSGTPSYSNILYYKQSYVRTGGSVLDPRFTFTAFLIDDEASGAEPPDAGDALLVCIGRIELGGRTVTARIEIELVLEDMGT